MRKALLTAVLAAALAAPAASRAQWYMGAKVGYAMPGGDAVKGQKLSDTFASNLPISLELLTKVNRYVAAGLYGTYGIGSAASSANGSIDSLSTYGVGVEAQVFPWGSDKLAPWLGLGLGWEWVQDKLKSGSTWRGSGFQGEAQAGLDFMFGGNLGLGPFVSYGVGQYSSFSLPEGQPTPEKALHQWLTIGARLRFEM